MTSSELALASISIGLAVAVAGAFFMFARFSQLHYGYRLSLSFITGGAGLILSQHGQTYGSLWNLIATAALLMLAVGALDSALAVRSRRTDVSMVFAAIGIVTICATLTLQLVWSDMFWRPTTLQTALGLSLTVVAFANRGLRFGAGAERAVFWALIILGTTAFALPVLNLLVAGPQPLDAYLRSTTWVATHFLIVSCIALHAGALLALVASDQVRSVRDAVDRDGLTGLSTRLAFWPLANKAIADAHAQGLPLTFIAIDVDDFRSINLDAGNDVGDRALTEFANLLRMSLRRRDLSCRTEGDEFLVALWCVDTRAAQLWCEGLNARLRGHDWRALGVPRTMTFKAGVSATKADATAHDAYLQARDVLVRNKTKASTSAELLARVPATGRVRQPSRSLAAR